MKFREKKYGLLAAAVMSAVMILALLMGLMLHNLASDAAAFYDVSKGIAYYDYIPTGPEAEVTYFIEHGVRWFVVVQGWVYNDEDGAYRTYLREQFPVAATGTNCVIYDLQGE